MIVAVVGSKGMLGKHVVRSLVSNGYSVEEFDHERTDGVISNKDKASRGALITCDALINCAGSIPLKGEAPEAVVYANAFLPWSLRSIFGGKIIQVSSDCVFSGRRRDGPYHVGDLPDPVDFYSKTKLVGEVRDWNTLVVRTSFIGFDHGLLDWFCKSAGSTLFGYTNAYWNGGYVADVAEALVQLLPINFTKYGGLVHLGTEERISKYQLLCFLRETLGLDRDIRAVPNPYINRELRPTVVLSPIRDSVNVILGHYTRSSVCHVCAE